MTANEEGMTTVQLKSEVSLDELLHGVEQLDTANLEYFTAQILALRAKRRAPSLSQTETELLQQINRGLPPSIQTRFDELNGKRREELLTPEEHQELLELIDQIEEWDAERIAYLAELAQIRGTTVRALMQELGIQRPAYA